MSKMQQEVYIKFLEHNPNFSTGTNSISYDLSTRERDLERLVDQLNATPGAVKDRKHWQEVRIFEYEVIFWDFMGELTIFWNFLCWIEEAVHVFFSICGLGMHGPLGCGKKTGQQKKILGTFLKIGNFSLICVKNHNFHTFLVT